MILALRIWFYTKNIFLIDIFHLIITFFWKFTDSTGRISVLLILSKIKELSVRCIGRLCDADLHRLSIINFKVVVKEVKIFFDFSII